MAYGTLWIAYGAPVFSIERWGDFSYGIYIYAYPLQQAVVAIWPGTPPLELFGIAGPVSLGLGVASWQMVEAPCLMLKNRRSARSLAVASTRPTHVGPVPREP